MGIKEIVYNACKTLLPQKAKRVIISILNVWTACKRLFSNCFVFRWFFGMHSKKTLRRIRDKHRAGKPIHVVFLVQFPEMWNSEKSLYQALSDDNRFITTILCVPKYSELNRNENVYYEKNDAYDHFSQNGFPAIKAFDHDNWVNIEGLKPDYIFIQRPYSVHLPLVYRFNHLYKLGLLCYIPYSGRLTKGIHINIEFNSSLLRYFSLLFADCSDSYKFVKEYVDHHKYGKYKKVYNIGFPRFDLITQIKKEALSCKKTRFLWLPRWSLNEINDKSHFLDYIQPMLHFFENHQDYSLVIRPHPFMFNNFIKEKAMSEDEVALLKQRVSELPNVCFDKNADYLISFNDADALISDVTSLLLEFFFTGKPIIFCDTLRDLTDEGKLIDETFYKASSFSEIEYAIERIKKDDSMKRIRRNNLEFLKPNGQSAAENIKNTLLKEATGV